MAIETAAKSVIRILKSEHAFEETLKLAEESGGRLVSNGMVEKILRSRCGEILSQDEKEIWTGTVVAYPGAGYTVEDSIEYTDGMTDILYRLETKDFRGLKNAALVLEAGTYDLEEDGRYRIYVPKSGIIVVENFPQKDRERGVYCRFEVHGLTGLPAGLPIVTNKDNLATEGGEKRMLYRTAGARVGPVSRETARDWRRSIVNLTYPPSFRLTMLVEKPGD